MKLSVLVILVCLTLCSADVYMHNPRGSNNRLNEANAVRNNGNRLFDSQNNNRGGYNVGDKTDNAFDEGDPEHANIDDVYNTNNANAADKQYHMVYYENSQLTVEWTNQHGCGGNEAEDPHKANCNMVIQYMCDKDDTTLPNYPSQRVALRNGGTTTDLTDPDNFDEGPNTNTNEGRQEDDMFYYSCEQRERNKGLLTLDQKLQGDEAIYTRQNPNGNRNGLECPEERDYYPYWSPSPWVDAAILTDHPELCDTVYATGSQNNNDVCTCDGALEANDDIPINQDECEETTGYTWDCRNKGLPAPVCQQGPWSRVNHLGDGAEGTNNNYTWTIPALADLYADISAAGTNIGTHTKCALRLRYNISTDDYDPWNVNASQNYELGIEQNPTVDAGLASRQGLELAINTNQFGRTFQDRSHLFVVSAKPAQFNGGTVYNLNVRGKRGNIVQTFPSVEYDFVPNRLEMGTGDYWHVQWTGSNTHNNGGDGGDGQAGDDGQGEGGTDRNNMVSILSPDKSFPIPLDKDEHNAINLIKSSNCYELNGDAIANWEDSAVRLAVSNYGDSPELGAGGDFTDLSAQLNNAPASLRGGLVCQTGVSGTYNYMSSRNNNFSNRGQKAWMKIG